MAKPIRLGSPLPVDVLPLDLQMLFGGRRSELQGAFYVLDDAPDYCATHLPCINAGTAAPFIARYRRYRRGPRRERFRQDRTIRVLKAESHKLGAELSGQRFRLSGADGRTLIIWKHHLERALYDRHRAVCAIR